MLTLGALGIAACSCVPADFQRPADGAIDVPVDAAVVHASALVGDDSIVLRGPDGAPVAGTLSVADVDYRRVPLRTFVPDEPLAPASTFEVTVPGVPEPLWTFTTGSARTAALPAPTISALVADASGSWCINSCTGPGGWDAAILELEADPGAAYLLLDTEVNGAPGRVAVASDARLSLSSAICAETLAELRAGDELCVRVRAVDASGRPSPASERVCTTVRDCATAGACPRECGSLSVPDDGASGCATSGTAHGRLALLVLALALAARRRRAA